MRGSICDGEVVTVFDLIQYFYCPRKVYFLKVAGVPVKVRRKMEYGREVHQAEKRRVTERKTVYGLDRGEVKQVINRLQAENSEIGLKGQVDTVLELRSGEIVPVEIKYTDELRIYRTFRKQLHAYALLLDHHYHRNITRGIIYFAKQKRAVKIEITGEEKRSLIRDVEKVRILLSGEEIPRKVASVKCGYCEVKKYCV